MNSNFYIVILAGGSGTRLWPISRCNRPKQFHNFCHKEMSLIQETYARVKDLVPKENIYVSLVKDILKMSQKQLPEIPKKNFIVEPVSKNTAPAIALATAQIIGAEPEAVIATIASDHTVGKTNKFHQTLLQAKNFLLKNPDYLVTIGIKPTNPNTGYGYIKIGRKFPKTPAREAEKFVEKPDLKTAETYLKNGDYLWNAGYFIFRASELLKMFKTHAPEIYRLIQQIRSSRFEEKDLQRYYQKMPSLPIDTAIAEKVKKIVVIPADLGWSDVGNWASLYQLLTSKKNNGVVSYGHHLSMGDKNSLIYAQDKLLATVGLEDIIIVDTPDVTLVCHKNKAQDVKKLIEKLRKEGQTRYL